MKQQQSSCLNYKTKIQKRQLKNITAKNCRLLDITNSTRQKGNLDLLNEKLQLERNTVKLVLNIE